MGTVVVTVEHAAPEWYEVLYPTMINQWQHSLAKAKNKATTTTTTTTNAINITTAISKVTY